MNVGWDTGALGQTAALQAFKVRWDDPAAGVLPERGLHWKECCFKQPGRFFLFFLFKLSLKTQPFFHKRNLPVRCGRIWASLKDSSSIQGPNSYLYQSSVGKLPLFKFPVAGAELKARPSEGFVFITSSFPEPESGSDHYPAGGRDKCQLGDHQESPICTLGSVWLGAAVWRLRRRRQSRAGSVLRSVQPSKRQPRSVAGGLLRTGCAACASERSPCQHQAIHKTPRCQFCLSANAQFLLSLHYAIWNKPEMSLANLVSYRWCCWRFNCLVLP